MTPFEQALMVTLRFEGGFSDDPADPGGATNLGVTHAVWEAWCVERGIPVKPMRDLTPADVAPLYEHRYWQPARCREMPLPLALIHFDCAVNSGVGQAARLFQRAAGVTVDGVLGPISLGHVTNPGVVERYLLERVWFYRSLVSQKATLGKFLVGWLRRLESLAHPASLFAKR